MTTTLPYPWFCRDMRDGRIEELIITASNVLTGTGPALAPSLDASNVGCWRWTAHVTMVETDRPSGSNPVMTGDSFVGPSLLTSRSFSSLAFPSTLVCGI